MKDYTDGQTIISRSETELPFILVHLGKLMPHASVSSSCNEDKGCKSLVETYLGKVILAMHKCHILNIVQVKFAGKGSDISKLDRRYLLEKLQILSISKII